DVVEGGHEDAPVQAIKMKEAVQVEIHGRLRLGAVPRRGGTELVLGAVAELHDVPGKSCGANRLPDPGGEALRQGNRDFVEAGRKYPLEGGAHGGESQGVSRQGPADPADVGVLDLDAGGGAYRHLLAHSVGGGRDTSGDRLADRQDVRLEIVDGGVSPRPGADRVRFVDHQERARPAGEIAQGLVIPGLWKD